MSTDTCLAPVRCIGAPSVINDCMFKSSDVFAFGGFNMISILIREIDGLK